MLKRALSPPAARADWAYFLDLDGTLIDIAANPDAVQTDDVLRALLAQLHARCGAALALVTGRALGFVDARLRLPQLCVAAQHGLERRDALGRIQLYATPQAAKQGIAQALAPVLERHAGLLLEDKGLTLALHYRRAPRLAAYVQRLMARLAQSANAGLEVQRGKFVAEIKPAGVDKGAAVADYLGAPPFSGRPPVYVGDDLTDERGFAEVNSRGGISIKVGGGRSSARFRLADVTSVRNWLNAV